VHALHMGFFIRFEKNFERIVTAKARSANYLTDAE
jgi:hypothetical protein